MSNFPMMKTRIWTKTLVPGTIMRKRQDTRKITEKSTRKITEKSTRKITDMPLVPGTIMRKRQVYEEDYGR